MRPHPYGAWGCFPSFLAAERRVRRERDRSRPQQPLKHPLAKPIQRRANPLGQHEPPNSGENRLDPRAEIRLRLQGGEVSDAVLDFSDAVREIVEFGVDGRDAGLERVAGILQACNVLLNRIESLDGGINAVPERIDRPSAGELTRSAKRRQGAR